MKRRPTRKQILRELKALRAELSDKFCTREEAQRLHSLLEQQSKITSQLLNKVAVLRKIDLDRAKELNDLIQDTKSLSLLLEGLIQDTQINTKNLRKLQESKGLISWFRMVLSGR